MSKDNSKDYDTVSVSLPLDIIEYLDELMRKTERNRSQVVKMIIRKHKEGENPWELR